MVNLINGEFYKLRKSKSFLVCCITIACLVAGIYAILFTANVESQDNQTNTSGVVVTINGEESSAQQDLLTSINITEIFQVVACIFASLITVIFNSIFVISEYGNGTIKNLAGKGHSRSSIFLAKYLICMLASVTILLIGSILTLVLGCIFVGPAQINAAFCKDYVIYTLLMAVLLCAINGITVTLSEISRSLGVGIAAGVCCVSSISSLLFEGLDLLCRRFSLPFRSSGYWLNNIMSECPLTGWSPELLTRITIAVCFWSFVAIFTGMLHFRKADIK